MKNSASPEVRRVIEITRKTEAKHLDLSNLLLTTIPDEVFSLFHLESIDLRGNFIQFVPIDIMSLVCLQQIDLRNNPVEQISQPASVIIDYSAFARMDKTVAAQVIGLRFEKENVEHIKEICNFPNMSILDLSSCGVDPIRNNLHQLEKIKDLNLSNNNLNEFPPEISNLITLESLDISHNKIGGIPYTILRLENLQKLNISNNYFIGDIPYYFKEFDSLEELNIAYNNFSIDPVEIVAIQGLESLDISSNKLATSPLELEKLHRIKNIGLGGLRIKGELEFLTKFKNLKSLDLSNNYLEKLPDIWGDMRELISLNLSNNLLQSIPDSFEHLVKSPKVKLTRVNFHGNRLSRFPEQLRESEYLNFLDLSQNRIRNLDDCHLKLPNLSFLSLTSNQFAEFPEQVSNLQNLNTLYLAHNQISLLPQTILKNANLTKLDISGNKLRQFPKIISELSSLVSLGIASLNLNEIDETIANLKKLVQLDASGNSIKTIPDFLFDLQDIRIICMPQNMISTIPAKVIQAVTLYVFDLEGNRTLSTPPYEVAKKGVATIRDYFKRINMQGTDHLNEAKIIVVGSPEVGKTSLVNKVKNPSYVLQPKEAYTRGINIVQWDCSSTEKNKIIHVGIWDFGGQQLYYSTHTFFLTKRSLYILVLDARKDDCTYSDWLNLIRSLSDKSPLIIVFNEKDDLKLDITENDLRMEYPNIVGIYSTNLATNEGLPELTAGIVSAVIQLKHLNDTLPKSWISVKERLRVEKREFIEFKEFRRICSLCGIDDKDEKECLNISSYLHDLGICFHYTKDPLLAKKVFLKPEWCTEAAYSLLDNKIIREQHGFFNDETVALIWKEMKLNENRAELINLMIEFKLCFRLRESRDKFIAPLLLTKEKPQYQWDDEDNFNIRIEYEFMPQGLISTLIAKMNDHIESPELVWKTGVILRKNGTKAEVIENNRKRFVSIKVHGPDKKEFFGAIDYVFDGIHGQLDDFSFKKMIACHCPRCLSANDPYFFEYDIIRDLFNAGVKTQKCGKKPFHDVDLSIIIGEYIQGQNPIQKPGQGVIDTIKNTKVFIVHGHDNSAKSEVARFLEQLDLEPVILNEQANGGKTIIEKIEMYSEASFAVVLYTPCDLGSEAGIQNQHKYRARQNVVFEHGYLMCKLGRCNVALIIKGDIEKPSDIADATYITMDNGRGWQIELAKELKKSNFKIDFNKVL